MSTIQIWAHIPDGEQYVVEISDDGRILDAAGPLHHSEIEAALSGDYNGDAEVCSDIIAYPESYRVVQA